MSERADKPMGVLEFYIRCKYGFPPVAKLPGDSSKASYSLQSGDVITVNWKQVERSREFKALVAGLSGNYNFREKADEHSAIYEMGIEAFEERQRYSRQPVRSKDEWPTFKHTAELIAQARKKVLSGATSVSASKYCETLLKAIK